ncbi:MAG: S-layer homology domain-containing protein, partial [Acidimicrobiaceae bacterium]|nr:S-layer homology domain-containing protein [Acidimicrobiaceae bacterium]
DGHYHRPDILCMYALGVTRGTGVDTFSPEQVLTRAEVAVFAARFHDAVPDG